MQRLSFINTFLNSGHVNNLVPADAKVGGYYSELEDIVKVGYTDGRDLLLCHFKRHASQFEHFEQLNSSNRSSRSRSGNRYETD